MRRRTCFEVCFAALPLVLMGSNDAEAHVRLIEPPPRVDGQAGGNQLKTEPCGQVPNSRTEIVSVFEPGATITLTFAEYIDHPSYYRIALDVDGDDSFPHRPNMIVPQQGDDPTSINPVSNLDETLDMYILQYMMDDESSPPGAEAMYSTTLTLPNIECENCTLQLIQFMYDRALPYYFQCADIVLRAETTGGSETTTSTGGVASTTAMTASVTTGSFDATKTGGANGLTTTGQVDGMLTSTVSGTSGSVTSTSQGFTAPSGTVGGATVTSGTNTGTSATGSGGVAAAGVTGLGQPTLTPPADEEPGCSCRLSGRPNGRAWALGLLALGWFGYRARRGSAF